MNRRSFLELASLTCLGVAAPLRAIAAPTLDTEWYTANRRFISLPTGKIAYVEHGSGPRAALFLHGFPLNGYQWRGALECLAPHRRCIAPDLLGMGYTEVAEGQPITPAMQVDMLVSLLDSLRVKDVDLVANDAGGLVAQLLIATHPKRVRTLLLTNCDVDSNNPPELFRPAVALAKRQLFADRYIAPQVANKQLARSLKGIGAQYTHPDAIADGTIDMYFLPLISSDIRKRQLDRYTVALGDNVLVPVRDQLKAWNNPVRMVWALQDKFFAVEWAEWLNTSLPSSRGVRRLDDANLFFPEEMPDLIAEEARSLWKAD